MSTGLFALTCPNCGTDLEVDPNSAAMCVVCLSSYLIRFGHLIPIGTTARTESAVLHSER